MSARSNSQQAGVSPLARLTYLARLSAMHVRRLRKTPDFTHLARDLDGYEQVYREATGRSLQDATALEIGFGQRPFRLIAMQSLGVNAIGIDLDAPLFRVRLGALATIARRNGITRAAKSLLRRLAFDSHEYAGLSTMLQSRYGRPLVFDESRMIVGDAGDPGTWARIGGPFDFVYSEDVCEHVPEPDLVRMLDNLADNLTPDGVAVVTPMIFTGIAGGHDLGWYPYQVDLPNVSRGPAWGHVTGESATGDTFLNRLTRADYRRIFGRRFVIESETCMLGEIGRKHLTPERKRALAEYSDDELFSNSVRFVLRKRPVS